jgi:hypothetical protein
MEVAAMFVDRTTFSSAAKSAARDGLAISQANCQQVRRSKTGFLF